MVNPSRSNAGDHFPGWVQKHAAMIKCKRIRYEALGMEHIAYCPVNSCFDDVSKLIKEISETALVFAFDDVSVSESEFSELNIKKVQEWLNDIKKYENEL